tara:strand:- start:490 stop:1470 length:981 start_codon:yes stop_codon:yes gene_type:complete
MKTKTLVILIAGVALILAAGTGPVAGFSSHPSWRADSGSDATSCPPGLILFSSFPSFLCQPPLLPTTGTPITPNIITPGLMPPEIPVESGKEKIVDLDAAPWVFLSLSVMAIVMLVAVAISFYLYRWRGILLREPHLTVPEKFGAWVNDLSKSIDGSTREVASEIRNIGHQSQETNQGIRDLSETFMTMQRALDEREEEIQRLKRGYDADIYRKFVSRFIRVDQFAKGFQQEGSIDLAGLEQIRRLLDNALDACGVECFQPQIGDDYREARGVAEEPKTVNTDRPEDVFKIAEILESGYQIRSAEGTEVIIKAKVMIYIFEAEEAS